MAALCCSARATVDGGSHFAKVGLGVRLKVISYYMVHCNINMDALNDASKWRVQCKEVELNGTM